MAVSVFPERMNKLDPEDVNASLRTIEDYISYVVERTEYALTNTFRTTTNLGGASEEAALALEELSDNIRAFEDETRSALTNKVDKVDGMGLSHNDYTDEEKSKLDNIEANAEVNVIETVKQNGTALPVTDKAVNVTVPTAVSELTNDSGFQTATQVQTAAADAVNGALSVASMFDLNHIVFPVHQENISIQSGTNLRTANLLGNYMESFGHNLSGNTYRSLVLTSGRATTQNASSSSFTLYKSEFKPVPSAADVKLVMTVRRFRVDVGNATEPPQIFVASYDADEKIWWANLSTSKLGYNRQWQILDDRVLANGNICIFVQFRRPTHTIQAAFDLDVVAADAPIDGATSFSVLTDSGKTVQEQT